MIKKISRFLIILLITLQGQIQAEGVLFGNSQDEKITVNNRILARVNGKAISVIDVMKKMDMLFYKQFPQFISSAKARHQFYKANWQHVLTEIIDKELLVADAEESKLVISAGDVRQEMESLFGPNIIANLDKIGLSFDEAYDMVLADITIRRMMYFRVQIKAISQATPQKINECYVKIASENRRDNRFIYQVVTVRHRDSTKAAKTADLAYKLLTEDHIPLLELSIKIAEETPENSKNGTVTLSEVYNTNEKELSELYKKTLLTLSPGEYSSPVIQKSRQDNSIAVRIIFLKEMIPGGDIPFADLESKIKGVLIEEGIEKESKAYIKRLREHFDVQEDHLNILNVTEFEPFELN